MITHKISPFTAPPSTGWQGGNRPSPGIQSMEEFERRYSSRRALPAPRNERCWVDIPPKGEHRIRHEITENSGKYIYTTWLVSLPFKRGDYVVNKAATFPYSEGQYLRVLGFQEVHYLCKFDHKGQPIALDLFTTGGSQFFASPENWIVVEPPTNPEWHFDLPVPKEV